MSNPRGRNDTSYANAPARLPAALQITLTDLSEGMVATAAQRVRAANDGWRVAARQAELAV